MPVSEVRAPRLIVLADGLPLNGAISAHVTSTNNFSADSFRVQLALSADPLLGAGFWSAVSEMVIEIQVELGGYVASLIEGLVDRVSIDPILRVVHLEGRDRTALLLEARTHETFANQTASEIAILLAGRHGLLAEVFPTTTPVGRYWQLEHDRITLGQFSRATTEWDLLVSLAGREGYNVWVFGQTLHFGPGDITAFGGVLRPVATLAGPASVSDLRLERALTLARDIEVVVKSWNSRMARGFEQTARATRGGRTGGRVQRYVFIMPDLTPDAALQLAQRRLAELTRHERVITADMPGDVTLDARAVVRVEATASAFDQDYYVDTIERTIDQRGFRQIVRAKNISPGVEIQ